MFPDYEPNEMASAEERGLFRALCVLAAIAIVGLGIFIAARLVSPVP